MRAYVGIDPGKSGGIAALDEHGYILAVHKMPEDDSEVLATMERLVEQWECSAMLEKVSSSPQMGVVSAFTFGAGFGALKMALAATRIPFTLVHPLKWQKAHGLIESGRRLGGGSKKHATLAAAMRRFPQVKITHAVADALLIADYCRLELRP